MNDVPFCVDEGLEGDVDVERDMLGGRMSNNIETDKEPYSPPELVRT